jgi:hypothetical protein
MREILNISTPAGISIILAIGSPSVYIAKIIVRGVRKSAERTVVI